MTSKLVWSTSVGYPADFNYREYYRDIGFDLDQHYLEPYQYAQGVRTHTGIKYHRITGPGPDKHLYNPDWARDTAERHARDFVDRCRDQAVPRQPRMPFPAVHRLALRRGAVRPLVVRGAAVDLPRPPRAGPRRALAAGTPGEYLAAHPIQQKAMPAPSSWGRNGYSEHWVNPKTDWMWRPLHEAAARMTRAVQAYRAGGDPRSADAGSLEERALRQAGRELMLAQSSDWPFIITNGTTEEYARRRFHDHLNRFHDLLNCLEHRNIDAPQLEALEYMDAIFPELDYRLFAPREEPLVALIPRDGYDSRGTGSGRPDGRTRCVNGAAGLSPCPICHWPLRRPCYRHRAYVAVCPGGVHERPLAKRRVSHGAVDPFPK